MISIKQLKRQLNVELTYTDDDSIMQQLLDTAVIAVNDYCGVNILTGYTDMVTGYTTTDENLPMPIIQATIMLAAHLYLNRGIVSFVEAKQIPYSFTFLLNPYKNLTIV